MKASINNGKIGDLFTRGVGEFIDPSGVFLKKLKTNPEKIVIKFGVDPTRPDMHLGHAVVLRKLRQFQNLGCKVIFLAGDFTAMIGDPTGKNKIRPEISQNKIGLNMKTYVQQIPKILKIEPTKNEDENKKIIRDSNNFVVDSPWFGWMRNSDWFLNVTDIISEGASKNVLVVKNKEERMEVLEDSFIGKAAVFENTRMQKLIKKRGIKTVSLLNFIANLRQVSHSQLIERDMFQQRIAKKKPLFMHEMLYPVAQGIDSKLICDIYGSCDLEVGGTDQTFNMLMGRNIMKANKQIPQAVLSFKLLEGTDGKEKMSKSLNNYIAITDEPNDMYGKVMSIPDSSIGNYFELCTFTPMDKIKDTCKNLLSDSVNPKEIKMDLAKQIVSIYYGEDKAQKAEENFIDIFQKRKIPENMIEIKMIKNKSLMNILVEAKILSSKGEFRRLVEEGAVTNLSTVKKVIDVNFIPKNGMKFKIGKKRFIEII